MRQHGAEQREVKTSNRSDKVGIDGGKKIKGIKRHAVVDTDGRMLYVKVHEANLHDTTAGGEVVKETLKKYPTIQTICGDAGYALTLTSSIPYSALLRKSWQNCKLRYWDTQKKYGNTE